MSASPSASELSIGLPAASAVGEPTVLGMRPKPALVLLILAALALTVVGYAWWALGVANGNWPTFSAPIVYRVGVVVVLMLFVRSEEHTSELQSLMRISYAVFCLKKKMKHTNSKSSN